MKFAALLVLLLTGASLPATSSQAEDIVIDGRRWASEAEATKGQNCPSNMIQLEETTGRAVWSVASSAETVYDFGKIEIPVNTTITPQTLIVLDGDISLATESYLELGLRLVDGRYFFANLKNSDALARSAFEFPVATMASSDGQPLTGNEGTLETISLMINSDNSEASGASEIRIEKVTITP